MMSVIGEPSVKACRLCDWVDVQQYSAREADTDAEQAIAGSVNSVVTPPSELSDEHPDGDSVGALCCHAQGDVATPAGELRTGSDISVGLKEEVHCARAQAKQKLQEYWQVQQSLTILEQRVREREDPEAANCDCSQCASQLGQDDDARSNSSDASADLPAVVEGYFQHVREAFLKDEQLTELELGHEVDEAARARRGDIDRRSPLGDSEDLYWRRRQELIGALAVAHYRLEVRRTACLAQGIDPERFRYRRP